MKPIYKYIFSILVITSFSCQTQRELYQLYKLEEFNINEGNIFVKKIQCLETVNEISIIDTKADGNDFVVNKQSIFLDTNQQDKPNYYNYKRRARELNISADCLLDCLKSFYKIGVNEFNKDDNYYRFPVVVGFTTNKGYIYSNELNLMLGDTLSATSVRNKKYHFKVVLTKQIDKAWFEYYQIGEI